MPSTYAHYIFGQQIRGRLSGYERKIIDKYPELFNIGLHGPDILFYDIPNARVTGTGIAMHREAAVGIARAGESSSFMQRRFYIHTTSMKSIWLMYMECSAILRWMRPAMVTWNRQ